MSELTRTERKPDRSTLRFEARTLQYLLQNYLFDQEFLANQSNEILYFVDAHELKSYIDPDNDAHLQGFILEAERAQSIEPHLIDQVRLRNEQILHSLLFDPGHQVGILPSHLAEVEEDLAFHAEKGLRKEIALLRRAREQVRRLSNQEQTRLLRARVNNPDDGTAKRDLIAYFRKLAPSLMTLMRRIPDDTQKRLEALGGKSNLVRAQDLDWSKFGFERDTCERLAKLRPSSEKMRLWREFLAGRSERQHNSPRSNRIDGEAIAYLQALNETLSDLGVPRVRGRLATRAMTLISCVAELKQNRTVGKAEFVRHPRMLARRLSPGNRRSDVEIERAFIVALQTYRRQLETLPPDAKADDERSSAAIAALVEAWQDFERARLTVELHAQADSLTPDYDSELSDSEFRDLLRWFGEINVTELINAELRRAVGRFGQATFALEKSVKAPIPIQVTRSSSSKRLRLIPTIAGAPGPVELSAEALPSVREGADVLAEFASMNTSSVERYLGWALMFACQERHEKEANDQQQAERRWELAEIYANSAISIGKLDDGRVGRDKAWSPVDEAHLLLAQIQRLGKVPSGSRHQSDESSKSDSVLHRYSLGVAHLKKVKAERDPRWAREHAALILELQLELKQQDGFKSLDIPQGSDVAEGIVWIERAIEWSAGDTVMLPRVYEVGLTFHLAAKYYDIWPERSEADVAVARGWHRRLQELLMRQRKELRPEEISRRALALEIIGFHLLQGAEPSDSLLAFARDLRAEIRQSVDQSAKLIEHALGSVSLGRRDLVSAPIWASHPTDGIVALVDDGQVAELMQSAYKQLTDIAGGSQQAAVSARERHVLEDIRCKFDKVAERLQSTCRDSIRAKKARFYARMEACYARLLLAVIEESDSKAQLAALVEDYQDIIEDYPEASIPHFRLDWIFTELGREDRAFEELTKARELVERDPFLRTPGHWVHSTMQRRIAARFSEEISQQRSKLIEGLEAGAYLIEQLEGYEQKLLSAFHSVYPVAEKLPDTDYLYSLEARRRINNVLYYASLVLEIHPGPDGFRKLGIEEPDLRRLLALLVPHDDITKEVEIGILHTIGATYAALGDASRAAAAGDHLINLLKTELGNRGVLSDAFRWTRREPSVFIDRRPGYFIRKPASL
ncbi:MULTISPECIES: hypothetical protein [unclassified Bradyrhizobium]|uniref:hypothetical protein n=1 Tax=unclassified Bradyrhizobium TaxID=2631580 RepID=UPI0028EE644B|nr:MULTISPECIES: hypothetical protein [unclassified Bradyrhizobium]